MSNLLIHAGDDRPIAWPLTDTAGVPLDVTGWTVRAHVRAWPDGPLLHEWSTDNGRAVTAPGSLSLLVDDSEDWTWAAGDYDLYLADPHGNTERIDGGRVRVVAAVTR